MSTIMGSAARLVSEHWALVIVALVVVALSVAIPLVLADVFPYQM
jgi:hypothetical protein